MDLVGTFALREKSEYVIFGDGIFADPSNKLLPIRSSNNDSHSMNAEDLSFGFVKGFFFHSCGWAWKRKITYSSYQMLGQCHLA